MRLTLLLVLLGVAACGPSVRGSWMPEGSDDPCVRADGETLRTIAVEIDHHLLVDEYDHAGSVNERHELACDEGGFALPMTAGTYTIELYAFWVDEVHLIEEEDPWGIDVERREAYAEPVTFTVDGEDVDLGEIVLKHDE